MDSPTTQAGAKAAEESAKTAGKASEIVQGVPLAEERVVRRLAAILILDVAGYSRLIGADEEGTHERLNTHLAQLVYPKVKEHRGRIVKTTGDGFLAEFASVVDAVRCAVEVQRGMIDREPGVPEEHSIRFRIGINLGDVIVEERDIYGDAVNVAARLEGLAEPGGVWVSGVVRDEVRDKLDYAFEDLGEQRVKNIARLVHLHAIKSAAVATLPPVLMLTKAPSLPKEFVSLNIKGTKIRTYTLDAKLIDKEISDVEAVSVDVASTHTTRLSTTRLYIFELEDGSHYPIKLPNFSLPFAIGVMVIFYYFKMSEESKLDLVYTIVLITDGKNFQASTTLICITKWS
jgi:class 3 adenylate cyclase